MKLNSHFSLTSIVLLLISVQSYAQDFSFKEYQWEDKNTTIKVPEQYKNEKEVVLFRNVKIEISVKGKEAVQYYMIHEKKYINSDDAIERNNRVYIPFKMDESVLETKQIGRAHV